MQYYGEGGRESQGNPQGIPLAAEWVTTLRFTHHCSSKSVSSDTVSGDLGHIHTQGVKI